MIKIVLIMDYGELKELIFSLIEIDRWNKKRFFLLEGFLFAK